MKNKYLHLLNYAFFLTFFLTNVSIAQNKSGAEAELSKLRNEISALENRLKSTDKSIKSELANIKYFDQQLTLLNKAMRIIRNEMSSTEKNLKVVNSQLDSLSNQITKLQSILKKQVVFAYKYQSNSEWDWLLGAKSINEALVRYQYFRTIAEHSQRVFERLSEKKTEVEKLKSIQESELAKQKKLAAQKAAEQKSHQTKRKKRQQLVSKISNNRKSLQQAIAAKRESAAKLRDLIASLTEGSGTTTPENAPTIDWSLVTGDFASQKKKLNWPVSGSILHDYGNYRNPRLKTVLVNNGIDIQAKKGASVLCVFNGAVSTITYIPGYGNTVIVDHKNGYFTIYAHLEEVLVNRSQIVQAGEKIGTVGDSGSLEGAKLHFEIYAANKPQNPKLWLKAR